ncbi:MAG: hypothetical protein ABMA15_24085 [Vicinamibacterales bacterium]
MTARLASAALADPTTDAQGRIEAWVSGPQAEHQRRALERRLTAVSSRRDGALHRSRKWSGFGL